MLEVPEVPWLLDDPTDADWDWPLLLEDDEPEVVAAKPFAGAVDASPVLDELVDESVVCCGVVVDVLVPLLVVSELLVVELRPLVEVGESVESTPVDELDVRPEVLCAAFELLELLAPWM